MSYTRLVVVLLIAFHGTCIVCQDMTLDMIEAAVGWANQTMYQRRASSIAGTSSTRAAWTGLDHFNRRNFPLRNTELSMGGEVTIRATRMLRQKAPVAGMTAEATLMFRRAAAHTCRDSRQVKNCDISQRYRETDGQCNNLVHRSYPSGAYKLGAAFTAQSRFLYPDYDDGVDSPRVSSVISGENLPNARLVSRKVHSGIPFKSNLHTPFLTHFGQFIDHDIVSTPESKPDFKLPNSHCCLEPNLDECFNIRFPPDELLGGGTCMRFMRADTSPNFFCDLGPRMQQNQRSSFIDGTMIYGFDDEQEMKLREPGTGYLITGGDNQLKLEPIEDEIEPPCMPVKNLCFAAGDHRSLETAPLTVIHIMFLRRHNLIVDQLRKVPLPWTPELLYQEAKRIVVAELQHITYNEFLPRVLGPRTMEEFELWPARLFDDSYSESVDPRTTSSFSVAAFRFGHSLVRNIHDQIGPYWGPINKLKLEDHFNRLETHLKPFPGGNTEGFSRWMAASQDSQADGTVVDGLQNRLFQCKGTRCPMGGGVTDAFDLAALNIQRGRDHGLPSYTKWREWCSGKRAVIFSPNALGLSDHSHFETYILRDTYRHVDDIDLFTGGLTEMRKQGALVGPTFACIIGKQFSNYKRGDRFFYERPDPAMAFTPEQLEAIKRTSLAKILCSTMRGVRNVQMQAMDVLGPYNPIVNCDYLNNDDLLAKIPFLWKRLPEHAFQSAAIKAEIFRQRRSDLPPVSRRFMYSPTSLKNYFPLHRIHQSKRRSDFFHERKYTVY